MKRDLDWHINVTDRNEKASRHLLNELGRLGVSYGRIVEIGAGTGTFLKVAKEDGAEGVGFEVNPFTQPYARDENGVDVRAEHWTKQTDTGPFDLMVSIMVLEHISEPRPLLKDMVEACLQYKASLFLAVPFVDRNRWHFLRNDDPAAEGSPFFDQDVHVTHFSSIGLEVVLKQFGMKNLRWIRTGLWHGVVASG